MSPNCDPTVFAVDGSRRGKLPPVIEQSEVQLVDLYIAVPEARQETRVSCVLNWLRAGLAKVTVPLEALPQANASIPVAWYPC
jgi:hypothetical protein